jgi:hypothetical protein
MPEKKAASSAEAKVAAGPVLQPKGKTEPPKTPGHSVTSAPPKLDAKTRPENKSRIEQKGSTNTAKKS